MRRHTRLVCGVKSQRIKVLRRRIRLGEKQIRTAPNEERLEDEPHLWVCPDSRVVVRPINTDQTDGTFRTINYHHHFGNISPSSFTSVR